MPFSLVFLKLGGSLITDKRGNAALRPEALAQAAADIRTALDTDPSLQLIVGHGSGSFGHVAAKRWNMLGGAINWRAYAEVGAAAARLNRHVCDALLAADIPAISLQPSASAIAEDGRIVDLALEPITTVLQAGAVPLVFGDVAIDRQRGYCIISTETIFKYLATQLPPTRIILAGQVDGVFTADPLVQPDAQPLPHLTSAAWAEIAAGLQGAAGVDVTGGMASKVRAMLDLVQAHPDLTVHLLSGLRLHAIRDALLGWPAGGTSISL